MKKSLSIEELVKWTNTQTDLLTLTKTIVERLEYQHKLGHANPEIDKMLAETKAILAEIKKLNIGVGFLSGIPQKKLAEMYELSSARISQIIKELKGPNIIDSEHKEIEFILTELPCYSAGNWQMAIVPPENYKALGGFHTDDQDFLVERGLKEFQNIPFEAFGFRETHRLQQSDLFRDNIQIIRDAAERLFSDEKDPTESVVIKGDFAHNTQRWMFYVSLKEAE